MTDEHTFTDEELLERTPFRVPLGKRYKSDDDIIGRWEPKPLISKAEKAKLLARVERLQQLATQRAAPEPTYACVCRDTGWVEVDTLGRGAWQMCEKCGGPSSWCRRHRRLKNSCALCLLEAVEGATRAAASRRSFPS